MFHHSHNLLLSAKDDAITIGSLVLVARFAASLRCGNLAQVLGLAWRPLGGDTGASALFHVIGRFSHGFPSNRASLATGEGAFRLIDGGKDCSAGTFPLRPERKASVTASSSRRSRPLSTAWRAKRFLVGGELHFHTFKVRITGTRLSSAG